MNIQKVIKKQGFTIASVAAKLKNSKSASGVGISQGALSSTLNGNPSIDKLQEIADIIGVSLSELVADEASEKETYIICPHCGEKIKISVSK
nr:MAG TPA: helix-turn-helix domain protein [Caudoviricetes sp.]